MRRVGLFSSRVSAFLLLVLRAWAVPSLAATYYLALGGHDANSGSAAQPFGI